MKIKLLIIGLIIFISQYVVSQPIVFSSGSDTTICLGTNANLHASITDTIIRETNVYTLSNIACSPYPYNTATIVPNTVDDQYYGLFQIGFNFCFYGQTYTQFWIGSNGWISFQPLSSPTFDPWTLSPLQALPNTDPARPRASIMACYRDWYPNASSQNIRYQTIGVSPNRKCIITYVNIPLYSCTSTTGTFQIVLHEWTNIIDVHGVNIPTCPTWNQQGLGIQGIQNAAGTQALPVPGRNVTTWTAINDGKRFRPNGVIIPSNIQWFAGSSTTAFANGPNVTVSPLVTTTYTAKISVCNNTISDAVVVNVEPCGTLLTSSTPSLCYGGNTGTATVTIEDGIPPYTFIWSNGSGTSMTNDSVNTISGLSAGTYSVTVSTLSGAYVLNTTIIVGQNPQLFVNTSTLPETCPGASDGIIIVTSSQMPPQTPFTYFCSGAINSLPTNLQLYQFESLVTGTYGISVSDAFGCTATTTSIVNQLSLSFTPVSSVISCHGDTNAYASINVAGGTPPYGYSWSTGETTQGITNLGAGTYSVIVTDDNGCQISTTYNFVEPDPVVIYSSGDQEICLSNSTDIVTAVIGGTIPYTYYWNPGGFNSGSIVVSPESSTEYCVHVVDENGCVSNTRCVTIEVNPSLFMGSHIYPDSICPGDTIRILSSISGGNGGPYFYQLYNGTSGSPIISNPYYATPSASRKFIIIGSDGCGTPPVYDTVQVTVIPLNRINIVADKIKGCPPLTVKFSEISLDEGQSYFWNFGDAGYFDNSYLKNPTHIFRNSGDYDVSLTVSNILGCKVDTLISNMIEVYNVPDAIFTTNENIVFDNFPVVEFNNLSNDGQYFYWSFGDGDSIKTFEPLPHVFPSIGQYLITLIVESYHGCTDTTYRSIEVRKKYTFYMPNAFNPYSNITENREYKPYGVFPEVSNFKFIIYDRWGEPIFVSTSYDKGWDGKYNGQVVPVGVYPWIITYDNYKGDGVLKYGTVVLKY